MSTVVEINYREMGGPRTNIAIEREIPWSAVAESLEMFLATLASSDRELVLGQVCRKFNYVNGDRS